MKRTLPCAIALSLALGLTATAASAADGKITITGAVTATTCDVAGGDGLGTIGTTPSFTVDLPHVSAKAFQHAADVAAPKPFQIRLTGCSIDGQDVRAYFHPAVMDVVPGRGTLKNKAALGSDVEVQLLDGQNTQTAINLADFDENALHQVKITGKTATLIYWAQYYAPTATVSAGPYSTTLDYTIDYR